MSAFGSALLITGAEQLLSSRAVEERRDAALAEHPEADVNRIDALELQGSMLAEVVGGSLFASHIVAIIDDVGATPPEVVEQLVSTAKDPGDELCLILVHEGGNKGKGLMDKLKKAKVETVTVATPKPWDVPKLLQQEARRMKLRLAPEAADALIAAVGNDLRALFAALAQLVADAGAEEVDAKLVQRYFAGRAEVSAFTVADAVLAGNAPRAMEQLRWALQTGAAPVLVTSAMAAGFRRMGRYLDLQGQRMSKFDLASQLGVTPKRAEDISHWSRNWQHRGVVTAIGLIATADAEVKGAATSAEYALERMVLGILAARR